MKLLEFLVSGTAHSPGYKLLRDTIKDGDLVEFDRDPHNPYDTAAIKVTYNGTQIGWVPKKLGEAKAMLDRLLEADFESIGVQATVVSHEPDNPTDMQLTVLVELLEFEE